MTCTNCKKVLHSAIVLASMCLLLELNGQAQVNVTTYHNNNARTGQNISETVLTRTNVNPETFGSLFGVSVDGQIYAQPLVLSNVHIGGGTHNVVYAVTENDSVYALDASTGFTYWQKSLGTPVSESQIGCPDITPQYGITSTPVIDQTSGTLYVVAQTLQNGVPAYQLHALSVSTGLENSGSPITIGGTVDGVTFNASTQHIRTALLLDNGNVFFGSGSHCDSGTWYGWVMAYNASTLQQQNVYLTEPTGNKAGVWMSGSGLASDSTHNLYFTTGNSDSDLAPDLSDSIVKLPPPPIAPKSWSYIDYFSPSESYIRPDPTSHDQDVGSGGVLLLPNTSFLVQVGKPGSLYLVDTATGTMGEYCGAPSCPDNIPQEIQNASVGTWGSPAYWNGNIYFGSARESYGSFGPEADSVKAYSFNPNAKPQMSGPISESPEQFAWPTPTPSVSSNGNTNGIVWVLDNENWRSGCCAVLHAYDAGNLSSELYSSNAVYWRDTEGGAIKFSVPTVANGHVYVGGTGSLTAYGVLDQSKYVRPSTDTGGVPSAASPQCVSQEYASPNPIPSAYDIYWLTFSTLDTNVGPSSTPFCVGRILGGWPAAIGRTTLAVDYSCKKTSTFNNPYCAVWLSENGGSSWQSLIVTGGSANPVVTPFSFTLPPGQDLTKLQIAIFEFGGNTTPFGSIFPIFSVYDVRVQ